MADPNRRHSPVAMAVWRTGTGQYTH